MTNQRCLGYFDEVTARRLPQACGASAGSMWMWNGRWPFGVSTTPTMALGTSWGLCRRERRAASLSGPAARVLRLVSCCGLRVCGCPALVKRWCRREARGAQRFRATLPGHGWGDAGARHLVDQRKASVGRQKRALRCNTGRTSTRTCTFPRDVTCRSSIPGADAVRSVLRICPVQALEREPCPAAHVHSAF
jgi:hypothetical protein